MGGRKGAGVGESRQLEILKSIVYGGLIESITSLGVVSSAAGAGAGTCKYQIFLSLNSNVLIYEDIQSSFISF